MKALAIVIGTLVWSISGVAAQPLVKSTMPDGKVIYSEKPVPGAKRVDTVEPPPARTGVTAATSREMDRANQATAKAHAATQQPSGLDDAREGVKKAEAAREAGKEPLPGERQGTAGGASRLNEAYFARQKNLEVAVEAARKRLQDLERR